MDQPLKIDFISDVACPWCAVGLASLERALERLDGAVPVELRFQPFELNPQMGPEGEDIDEHLVKKYGGTPAQFEASRAALRERGAAVGFEFGHRERIHNTFDAHRLLHWAGLEGRQHELKHALLVAYHGQGRDPSDPAVLVDVAQSVGLDGERAAQILAGDEYAEAVRAEERHWTGLGISAVPSVVVNGRHLIQGGQPPEVFEQALRQIAAAAAD
ncbi:MAG: DsbA family oxidoreductase [Burkholderiales bacterium]|nr:DsbA family oxidoreductase [Burkholderiales bacterium]MDE2395886.1 DsbA family oxidoreductase [Burkholderiales bacterium]MDE2456658.1 DsbA family oxidoreductase [Burkholderiales bacterium]